MYGGFRPKPRRDIGAGRLSRLAVGDHRKSPVVLFADDVHDGDPWLPELVDGLLGRGGVLLVVTAGLPHRLDDQPSLGVLIARHDDRLWRVGDGVPARSPFPEWAGLEELETEARGEMLHQYHPRVEAATREALLKTYTRPSGG